VKNAIHDSLVITKRQLLQLARVPELLVFSTSAMYLADQLIQVSLADMCSF
jgi:hypothetical protein